MAVFLSVFCSGVYSPDYDNCSNVQYVSKQPRRLRKGDFGSDRDLNHWPPPHDSPSGGDSVYRLSAIPIVSFRSNSFTICRPSPMLVQKMSITGHGDSDSSGISSSTRLPDVALQDPAMDLAFFCLRARWKIKKSMCARPAFWRENISKLVCRKVFLFTKFDWKKVLQSRTSFFYGQVLPASKIY